MKVLVITSEPISADALREAVGDHEADDAEVMVISPALQDSKLRFWMSDADDAIAKAEHVQEESVERLDEEGIDAAGDTGESDPAQAAEDTLAGFPADLVVVFSHPDDERAFREDADLKELEERLGVPLVYREVTRDRS